MEQKHIETIQKINMPAEMKAALLRNCRSYSAQKCKAPAKRSLSLFLRRPGIAAAALMLTVAMAAGTTSYAAYNLYQVKNLRVFFKENISQEEIAQIGQAISQIEGVRTICDLGELAEESTASEN